MLRPSSVSAVSSAAPFAAPPAFSRADRILALLLGLHGLALLVVFPLGPQESRLWHPGVVGVAALAAAFPLAAALAGLLARRLPRLPAHPAALTGWALLGTVASCLSFDYPSFVTARVLGGAIAGLSYVAIHRTLPLAAGPLVARLAPRIVAFGMPLCLLLSTALDWRFGFAPILLGQLSLLVACSQAAPPMSAPGPTRPAPNCREAAPSALIATAALAVVSAAYLTVLSGFLVFNAGHTEWHIPAGLLLGALLGFLVPPGLARLRRHLPPSAVYGATLALFVCSLLALLALRGPLAAPLAVGAIACFLATSAGRHLALAQLVLPRLEPRDLPAHQTHNHLAHHFGMGLGALAAGQLVFFHPDRTFGGMEGLFACGVLASGIALLAGLVAARAPTARAPASATPAPLERQPETLRTR